MENMSYNEKLDMIKKGINLQKTYNNVQRILSKDLETSTNYDRPINLVVYKSGHKNTFALSVVYNYHQTGNESADWDRYTLYYKLNDNGILELSDTTYEFEIRSMYDSNSCLKAKQALELADRITKRENQLKPTFKENVDITKIINKYLLATDNDKINEKIKTLESKKQQALAKIKEWQNKYDTADKEIENLKKQLK